MQQQFAFYCKNVGLIKDVKTSALSFRFFLHISNILFSDKSFITIGKDIVTEYDIITGEFPKNMLQSFIFEEYNF